MVKAEDKNVPVIVVNKDVNEIITGIERALAASEFKHSHKLSTFASMMDSGFDIKGLTSTLGI